MSCGSPVARTVERLRIEESMAYIWSLVEKIREKVRAGRTDQIQGVDANGHHVGD